MPEPEIRSVELVVPCFNEAERLDTTALGDALAAQPALHLVLVDDGSTDATRELLEGVAAACPGRVEVLPLPANRGKAEAVRTGLLHALARAPDAVGYWDADLATPLDQVPRFARQLGERADLALVMGCRLKSLGRDVRRSAVRHYVGRVFATFASLALGAPAYDTQCGAKLLRAGPGLEEILREPFETRWLVDLELLFRLRRQLRAAGSSLERAVYEIPLERWHHGGHSKVTPGEAAGAFLDLARLHRRYREPRAPRPAEHP